MNASWVTNYLGKPWENGARGPNAFDCWGLVYDVYKNVLNKQLPIHPGADAKNRFKVNSLICLHKTSYIQLQEPEDFCIVLMYQNKVSHHVGLYIEKHILHSQDGVGVTASTIPNLTSSTFRRFEYFKVK